MRKFIFSVLCVSVFFTTTAQHLPDYLTKCAVFAEHGTGSGSGFFLSDSSFTYFVTAKHIIFQEIPSNNKSFSAVYPLTDTLRLTALTATMNRHNKNVITLDLLRAVDLGLIYSENDQDIVIIKMGEVQKRDDGVLITKYFDFIYKDKNSSYVPLYYNDLLEYDDVQIGDAVFLFGYPTSIGIAKSPQFDYSMPLLRNGVVAGKYDQRHTIIIDCPSYPGNSGGPVISKFITRQGQIKYYLIGIVVQYIPYQENWVNERDGSRRSDKHNSGYSVVVSIDSIKDLIKSQPMKKLEFDPPIKN